MALLGHVLARTFDKYWTSSGGGEDRLNQYVRVERVAVDKSSMIVSVGFYSSQQARNDEILPYEIQDFEFLYVLDGDNPIKQAYTRLKETPKFGDLMDV